MSSIRYRYYRVHKYVCFELSEFDRVVAKANFLDTPECDTLKEKLFNLSELLKHHAEYEDVHIHDMLRKKNSKLQLTLEDDHQAHEKDLDDLMRQLNALIATETTADKIMMGHDFYLSYRLFYSNMLKHLYDEETILLAELQSLYSDQELANLQAKTYQKMTSEQMLGMLNVLFPHANPEDMHFFTQEMKASEPQKFKAVWEGLDDHYKQAINLYIRASMSL